MPLRHREIRDIAVELALWEFWEAGWPGAILRGASVTLAIGLCSICIGITIGTIGGLVKWARLFPFNLVVDGYTTLIRGVPELLVIYLLFFSSAEFVSRVAAAFGYGGANDSAYGFIIGVAAIGIISGAYSVEVVRGALVAVPKGHIEAGRALGMSSGRIFRRIIAPQMLRLAVPGMNNIWQSTMKDTALISVVGLQELMRISSIGAGSTRQPLLFYTVAAAVYLAITVVSQTAFGVIERILNKGNKV